MTQPTYAPGAISLPGFEGYQANPDMTHATTIDQLGEAQRQDLAVANQLAQRQIGTDTTGWAQGYNNQIADRQAMNSALAMQARAAEGQGPSTAQAQFGQQLNASMMSALNMGADSRGDSRGAGVAAAQAQGLGAAGAGSVQAMQQAAAQRQRDQLGGMQSYGQGLDAARAANLAFRQQGMDWASQNAQLQQQQAEMNQQGVLQALGMRNNALAAQYGEADRMNEAWNGLQAQAVAGNAQQQSALIGGGAGAVSGALSGIAKGFKSGGNDSGGSDGSSSGGSGNYEEWT